MQSLVNIFNSIGSTGGSAVSSFLTLNYYLGDLIFSAIKYSYTSLLSLLGTLITALGIILEDLVIFLAEICETVSSVVELIAHVLDVLLQGVGNTGYMVQCGVLDGLARLGSWFNSVYTTLVFLVRSAGIFFNLLGSSLILLLNLIPHTLYILISGARSFFSNFGEVSRSTADKAVDFLVHAPPELYLGMTVGTVSAVLLTKVSIRTIRERNITLESCASFLLRLVCRAYVLLIRSIARCVGLMFTILEVTVSNIRLPMISHAGDSDDDEEDRENLVGELEESDDEDRERAAQKRKNYDLLLQRRKKSEGGSSQESVENLLIREVEREREDKLCVICVDKEKCIMILPCRHLCICESCQIPLRTHRNICPICRKEVKQMIKAYL